MPKAVKILDTSALLDDPTIVKKIPDARIVIPFATLKELDQKKSKQDEIGRNAREIIRILDSLEGDISSGVPYEQNSTLEILNIEFKNNGKTVDEYIIETAKILSQKEKDVCLISQDINMRVRAKSLKIKAEPILTNGFHGSTNLNPKIYTGIGEIELDDNDLNIFMSGKDKNINLTKYINEETKYYPNQFLKISNDVSGSTFGIIKIVDGKHILRTVKNYTHFKQLDCKPRNLEQNLAINLMLDSSIHLVSLSGRAGTGKTLLALACALYLQRTEKKRIIITKPMVPVGNKELGFLPGSVEEKINPYFGSIFDNLRYLVPDDSYLESMILNNDLVLEPISLFRGRSISNSVLLIDELQNNTKLESKTLITRVGENTKVLFTADPEQIDTPYLDSINNGAVYCVEKLKHSELVGHLTLTKGERSKLATLAAAEL